MLSTWTGGLLLAFMALPSAPVSPIALHPSACSSATMFLLHQPAYTMVTTFSVSSSVILRPSTIFGTMPISFCIWLAMTPPPWTSTFMPGMAAKSLTNSRRSDGLSTTFPPIFTTFIIGSSKFLSARSGPIRRGLLPPESQSIAGSR